MPVVTNQPSPQVINPYWQKQVVTEKQEQRSEEIPEFVRENPSLLPWYRRTMESAANRGVKSVTFRQVPVREEVQEQEVPDAFKQDANLSNWYGRVMESARERGASNVTFTTVPAQPKESEMPDFFKENPSLQPWYQRVMASAAEREVKSVSFAFLEVPKSVASETKYPRTDVGLALKVYPMVSGFLGSSGQPSISEMLLNIRISPLYQGVSATSRFENIQRSFLKQPLETKPFAVIAGILSVPEGLTYSLLNLASIPTRNLPPAPSLAESEYSLGWAVGEIGMTLTVAYVGGKILTGVTQVGQWIGGKLEEKTHVVQRIKLSPIGEWYYGTKEKVPANPLKFKGSDVEDLLARQSESYRDYIERQVSSGSVDEPLATSVPEFQSIKSTPKDTIEALEPLENFEYRESTTLAEKKALEIMKGATEPPIKVSSLLPSEVDYIKNISGFDWTPEQKAAYIAEAGKLNIPMFESAEHITWKFPLSLTEQAETLKLVGDQQILETPESIRAIQTAEKLGVGVPHTAMIDPFNAELIEVPTLERPIAGVPFMPKPEVTARVQMVSTNLGKFVSASAFLGFEAFKVTKSTVKSQPSLSFSTKVSNLLSQPSRVDLALTPDVASMVEIVQLQKLEPLVETVQIQKPLSMTKMVSPTRSLYRFDFPKDISMMKQDFKVSHRKKRKSTSGLYLWEFPILDPEKVLRMT